MRTSKGLEVGFERGRLATSGDDPVHHLSHERGAVHGQHGTALIADRERDPLTNALGRAGDDHHLVLKSIAAAHFATASLADETFSNRKLFGVTPTVPIHLRTPSTIGGGPHT